MSIGIGETLRGAREQQGRTIDEASRATRVRTDYLHALEDERFDLIGGDVYAKGFLATYARWLGLDAEPLLDLYREQVQRGDYDPHALVEHPVAKPASQGATNWVVWAAVLILVLLGAFGIVGTLGGRTPQPAAEPQIDASDTEDPTEPSATPTESATPTPSPTPTDVDLTLLLEGNSWARVQAGGEVVYVGTLRAGEQREFTAEDQILLRLGNAGQVRLVLNGEDLGTLGASGDVIDVACTPSECTLQEDEATA